MINNETVIVTGVIALSALCTLFGVCTWLFYEVGELKEKIKRMEEKNGF